MAGRGRATLYGHPAIKECCIISTPDAYRGEGVKALVVLHVDKADTSADDIIAWARDNMASYKAPRSVVFVGSLPRSESNKISWRLLQEAEWKP
ncbi:hypothetical protein [Tardiphaga sp.]|uniref:AMP-binding enzyme n=1 Tax=Tardiphaga sp. TaxID=1926292 RepID=UPI0025E03D54|nr:hypothetical protein [Tardiphaga sp.]